MNNMYLISASSQPASLVGTASADAVDSGLHSIHSSQPALQHSSSQSSAGVALLSPPPSSPATSTITATDAVIDFDTLKNVNKNLKNLSITQLLMLQRQQQQQKQQLTHNSGNSKLTDILVISSSAVTEMAELASNAIAAAMVAGPSISNAPSNGNVNAPIASVAAVNSNNDNGNGGDNQIDHNSLEELYKEPLYFGTENSTTITTQIGANAHLPCTIHHIGEGVVSWIRRKDYHLLTVSLTTYSSDERYSVTHMKHSEDWTLQIKYVQLRDAGLYECQVSVHPPTSIFIFLNVVEARAEIVGPPIRYLTPGSTLKLMCRIVQNTEASAFIFWYHDNRMINYDVDRGINVSTEADYHYSELTIQRTKKEHSGNYTCVPSNAQPAFVLVHIFKGDNPAAMYHEHRSAATSQLIYQQHQLPLLTLPVLLSLATAARSVSVFSLS